MKIKINVINDAKESSVQDEDYLEQAHTIGQPVHVGDILLVKAKDKLFKCEVVRSDNRFSSNRRNQFDVRIYPLDEKDKHLFESATIQPSTSRKYLDGSLSFDVDLKTDENGDTYWEIDFTKGYMGYEVLREKNVSYSESLLKGEPFTVVKFLTKSVPSSAVQDNDLTEYRNSIKPDGMEHLDYFKETRRATGQPVHVGDVLLVKAKDKVFKCEIQDDKTFRKDPNLFSVKVYPLDKDYKAALENDEFTRDVLKKNYLGGILNFDMEIKHDNDDTYWGIDFTKGKIQIYVPLFSKIDELKDFKEFVPFTVVKFLTHSVPTSTVQDAGIKFDNLENDISEDLNNNFSNLYYDCIDFTYLLEDYEKAIEEIIYNDEPSDEYDEDPKDREYKDYLEKVAFCIPDIIYSLKDLEKEIQKRR